MNSEKSDRPIYRVKVTNRRELLLRVIAVHPKTQIDIIAEMYRLNPEMMKSHSQTKHTRELLSKLVKRGTVVRREKRIENHTYYVYRLNYENKP